MCRQIAPSSRESKVACAPLQEIGRNPNRSFLAGHRFSLQFRLLAANCY
jgi:hypothetical protein